jgi:hypothetical protein
MMMKTSALRQLHKAAKTAEIRGQTLRHIERTLEIHGDDIQALVKAIQGAIDNNRREEFSLSASAA